MEEKSKNNKKVNETLNNLKDVESSIEDLSDVLDNLTSSMKPMMDMNDLGKSINQLKNMLPTDENMEKMTEEYNKENENPPCVTCTSLVELVEQYPNDSDLGEQIRNLYKSYQKLMGNTEE